jgi:Ca-activated chloride channel homolog
MNRTRSIFFMIILIALGLVWWVAGLMTPPPQDDLSAVSPTHVLPSDRIELYIASSSTKQTWMEDVASHFQQLGHTTSSGKKIVVRVTSVSSGGSTAAIIDGSLKPVAWSPGSGAWVAQLQEGLQRQGRNSLMSKDCHSSVYTPLGIAMWRPMAEALGWPQQPVSWKKLLQLASDPQGWARYDHPEWGKFRFGHAHPAYGNSGLLTMTSFIYGMIGRTEVHPQDIYTATVKDALRALAQNTSKYGVVTEDLVALMVNEGPRYLHAIATYEADAVAMNLNHQDQLRFPIAFIFPAEGAFWGEHPYCVLDKAEWVSAEHAEAARLFYDFLRTTKAQQLAIHHRLRPLDTSIALHAPLDLAHGTVATITPATVPPLPEPSGDISQMIIDVFLQTKRKATIMLVLDTSGSMSGVKIRSATEASANFLKRLHSDDRIGLITFSSTVTNLQNPQKVSESVEKLAHTVQNLLADGNTALYAAVCETIKILQMQREQDQALHDSRLYGMVLLSDGDDTMGYPSEMEMFATCLPAHAEADGIKIYTIAFGDDANQKVLQQISKVSGGTLFTASPQSLEKIYLKISAEQ